MSGRSCIRVISTHSNRKTANRAHITDQSRSLADRQTAALTFLSISPSERAILRGLASQVAEIAARPLEKAKRDLWYRHNALEATRPVIFCDPENGWNEIIKPEQLTCQGELARGWEMRLRKEIFWGEQMRDDRVIERFFDIAHVYTDSGWGFPESRVGGQSGGAYTWDPPLKDYFVDFQHLHIPGITVDFVATGRLLTLAQESLGDRLTVRLKTAWWWTLGMTSTLIRLRGLEQMMLDMLDQPADLHRLMAFLRDGHLAKLDFLEQERLLSLNNEGTYVGSGGFGCTRELPQADFTGEVRTRDMWGFAESQETVGVSPAMFTEFILPYQLPILERFGLNCYGCCEPVDKRWGAVARIPRLRRISVSPWSSVAAMADRLGDRYIFSWKPRPSDLAMDTFDEERIRSEIRQTFALTRACRVEAIMKDNHTIHNDPRRVVRWVQIAREEAERV